MLTENVNAEFDRQVTTGEWIADRVAEFGGSWTFIICFAVVMAVWILLNTVLLVARPFDPYPFFLLNLMLSCLAAIQAPVIMMSQNRQEAKDRSAPNMFTVSISRRNSKYGTSMRRSTCC